MRLFHTFTLFYFLACSLDAGESKNPLEGSLRDPWGILSGAKTSETKEPPIQGSPTRSLPPTSPSVSSPTESTGVTFGPSVKAFKAQYNVQLDFSTFGETGHDSLAARYDRGVTEWDQFQLNQTVVPSGAIFYGNPGALVTNRSPPDVATPITQWPLVPLFTFVCASLLLIWAYLRVRYRAKCTSDI